jgi:hypothetical protein
MDITYIPMARGFVYLAVVLDWFSRRVQSCGYRSPWSLRFHRSTAAAHLSGESSVSVSYAGFRPSALPSLPNCGATSWVVGALTDPIFARF